MLDIDALAGMMAGIIGEHVDKAVKPLFEKLAEIEGRVPETGPAGEKGEPGQSGENGRDGVDGKDGADGRGVKDLLIDREGQLVATMDDGEMKVLGPVVGKDGRDGESVQLPEDDLDLPAEDKATLLSGMLRKELGDEDWIVLPEPAPAVVASTKDVPQLVVHNHLPKRGIEKTTVTKHDERGRIMEYERREV